jgi:hypothetical protein
VYAGGIWLGGVWQAQFQLAKEPIALTGLQIYGQSRPFACLFGHPFPQISYAQNKGAL